jgi:UPF0176 protein
MPLAVASFYKFVTISDGAALRTALIAVCRQQAITGTILLAPEGINATVAGASGAIGALLNHLRADVRFNDLTVKHAQALLPPFRRLKVKLKKEIVTFGKPEANPAETTGKSIGPAAWNTLLDDPGTVVIDTRNAYEVAVGSFPGALNPQTTAFGQFPDFVRDHLDPIKHRKIAMFCTGGIRCEKASAYLLSQGFSDVYQLEGGILKYLEEVSAIENRWQGECYVFDGRVALQHGLDEGSFTMRLACGHPIPKSAAGTTPTDSDTPCPLCPQCAAR